MLRRLWQRLWHEDKLAVGRECYACTSPMMYAEHDPELSVVRYTCCVCGFKGASPLEGDVARETPRPAPGSIEERIENEPEFQP